MNVCCVVHSYIGSYITLNVINLKQNNNMRERMNSVLKFPNRLIQLRCIYWYLTYTILMLMYICVGRK